MGTDIWTDAEACFSPDYATARNRFLAACVQRGAPPAAYPNPNTGPGGEELAVDVAWFGPPDAGRILVLQSATHGVEGFTGSAAQLDWLTEDGPSRLPGGVATLLIHAINPHGFAWLRRVTEEGVDLNRNWVDFDQPLPENPGYAELGDAFLPTELSGPIFHAAEDKLKAWRAAHGERAFEGARGGGQHTHPTGLCFGGLEPTWSRRTLETIIADHGLAERRLMAVIDFHTGLGRYGYGEPICGHRPDTPGQARARAWYGDSLGEPLLGTSASLPIVGLTQYGWDREVGDRHVFIALEFGTYPTECGRANLRDDHWLHAYGAVNWGSEETRRIKAALRKHFYPDTDDWREMVLFRSRQVIKQALAGLVSER